MKKWIFTILVLLPFVGMTQTDTEFWFAAPEVSQQHGDRPIYLRMTALSQASIITLSEPANPLFPIIVDTIPSFGSLTIDLTQYIDIIENKPDTTVLNYGLHLTSDHSITAYYEVATACACNPEIFTLKGKNALGTYFLTPFQTFTSAGAALYYSGFNIIATVNNTIITITPSHDTPGHPAGIPFTIVLNMGETYTINASGLAPGDRLAGTLVTANQSIAITIFDDSLSGAAWGGCGDLCGDQIIPVQVAGKQYIIVRGFLNGGIEKVFILGTVNNTDIFINGSSIPTATINAGQTYTYSLSSNSVFIDCSQPVFVLHLSGFSCELGMPIVPPIQCTGSSIVGFTRSTNEFFGIVLLTQNGNQGGFSLNGNSTVINPASFFIVPGTSGQWVATKLDLSSQITAGAGSLISNNLGKFHLGIFNGGSVSGCRYGYFSDFSGVNLGPDITKCPLDTITLDAGPGKTSYYWNNGITSQTVQVTNPGIYSVTTTDGGCTLIDSITIINKIPPTVSLGNDTILCENQNISISPGPGYTSYAWSNGSSSPSINITQAGFYWVKVAEASGCIGMDTVMVRFRKLTDVGDTVSLLPENMLAWYPFDGNTLDYSGNNHNGSAFNDFTYAPGPVDSSIAFVGYGYMTEAGGHVVIPDIDLETYPAFTISLYAKEDGVTSTDGEAYIFYGDATNGMISIANYGGLGFFVGSAVVGMPFPPSYLHQWKKYTLVWEAPILMAYVNDSLINTASGIAACWGGVKGGVARHWWYSNTVSSTRLIGNIDDIRIYKRALCDYEVMVGMNTRVLSATVSSASICTGDSSTIMLHNPQPGIQYQMINQGNGAPVGLPMGPVCDSIILFQTGPLGSTQQYTILAKDTNYNCQKTLDTILTVTVNPIPVANILPGNTSLCLGDSVLLTAYSSIVGASYNWADSQTTQSIWVKSAGISDYIVTVTNNGCSDTAMASVTINTIPGITIVPVNPVACQGDTVQLTANPAPPGGSFVWNTGTTTASVNVIPLVSGTQYSVKYTLNGCSNNDSVSIQLNPLPVVSISPATAEICEGDTLTLTASSNLSGANWTWNSGQNTASILIQPLVSTVYNVTATVNDCDGQANLTVVLHPMPTITMNPAVDTICEGDTILLTASSNQEGLTYTWNTGMMDSLISIHPTTNSTYWVTVTNDWCENKNSAFIQVDLIPEITVSPSDTTICKGDAIILNVNTSAPSPGFHWNFGATQASLSVSTNYTTLYQVTVTSGLCAASGGVLVDVVPVPDVNLGADDYICEGSTVVLNCQLGYSAYLWSDGSQGSALEVSQPGLVWVRVYDKGCSNSDTITLLQCTEIFVPNVFTPNGDGKNDNFYPKGVSVNDFEMFIFNRWGEFLFSTTDMLAGWDGRYKGELCIDGVYYYLINYTGTGIKRQINGIVTLMK